MYPLINKIPLSIVHDIYYYNNYSDLDLEYFKFEHKDKMNKCLIEISKAGDYYRQDGMEERGIDFIEYLYDFTSFKTLGKHKAVSAFNSIVHYITVDELYDLLN
tara:strand:- start:1800 stop:2111 length:312 start_codon:yes stop_codon:yes gene_type:complete